MGKLFLSGGGDEKQTFEVDEVFLQPVDKILYVPIARPNNDFESCLKWFTNAMSQHKKVSIQMLTDLKEDIGLGNYDAIYIGGGNTFKLLKIMKNAGFDKKLIDYYKSGGTVYGGSAGAIIWGKDINTALISKDADVNNVGLKDTSGFDALNGIDVQCHYVDSQLKKHQEYIAKTGRNIIAIPEESALLLENGKITVLGTKPITLITKDTVKTYAVNEEINLTGTKSNKIKK